MALARRDQGEENMLIVFIFLNHFVIGANRDVFPCINRFTTIFSTTWERKKMFVMCEWFVDWIEINFVIG